MASALESAPTEVLSASVRRLMDEYRSGPVGDAPILTAGAAYAAYRMPATFAAALAPVDPGWHPPEESPSDPG